MAASSGGSDWIHCVHCDATQCLRMGLGLILDHRGERLMLSNNHTERQRSGSFEVLTLAMMLGNGSGTHFGASQCIPMGLCRLSRCLTLGVVMPLVYGDVPLPLPLLLMLDDQLDTQCESNNVN